MNWKKVVLLGFAVACVFAASPATAQMRGHGSSIAPMPMQRAPMRNSASGFHHFNDGHFIRNDRFHRFTASTRSSLSATSAFHGGGVGAGVLGGAGTGATHTDTTAATVPIMDTAIAVGLEWPTYSAGSLAPAITMAPSMESWVPKHGEQFALTSAIMVGPRTAQSGANLFHFCADNRCSAAVRGW